MMGDMAEPWRSMRHERQKQVASGKRVSMKYRTEADREWGQRTAYEAVAMCDRDTLKNLKKQGLDVEYKSLASFQITLPVGKVMFFDGKKGTFIYAPQLNKKYKVNKWLEDIKQILRQVSKDLAPSNELESSDEKI